MKKSLGKKIVSDNIITFIIMGIFTVVMSVLSISLSIMLTNIIDNVLPVGDIKKLLHHIAYYILISIGLEVFLFIRNYWNYIANLHIGMKTRKDIVNKIFQNKGEFYSKKTSGELYKLVVNDVDQICSFIMNNFFGLLSVLMTFLLSSLYLVYLNWKLYLMVLLLQPVMFIVQSKIIPEILKISEEYHGVIGQFISTVKDIFANPVELIISGCKMSMLQRMNNAMDTRLKVSKKLCILNAIGTHLSDLLLTLTLCVVIGYGGYCIIHGEMTIGALVVYITYSQKNMSYVRSLVNFTNEYTNVLPIYKKLNNLYRTETEQSIYESIDNSDAPSIELRSITFSYDGKRDIYKKVSYKFEYGKTYGIIGKSGEGKSTLIKLLFGLWKTEKGKMYLGGSDCELVNIDDISEMISYVSIHSPIVNDTIFNNIMLESEEMYSERYAQQALERACLYDDVMNMEKKMNTIVGEGGCLLSTGQRQRLLLARAFMNTKKIIILDEPTSAIDQATKEKLMTNIYDAFEGTLLIIITHDKDILYRCDEIIEVHQGKFRASRNFS